MRRQVKVSTDSETSFEDKVIIWKCEVWRAENVWRAVRENHSEKGTRELRSEWWEGARQVRMRGRQFQTGYCNNGYYNTLRWEGKESSGFCQVGLSTGKTEWERLGTCAQEHVWIWLYRVTGFNTVLLSSDSAFLTFRPLTSFLLLLWTCFCIFVDF